MVECLQQWNDAVLSQLLHKYDSTALQNGLIRATGEPTTNYIRHLQYANLRKVLSYSMQGTRMFVFEQSF